MNKFVNQMLEYKNVTYLKSFQEPLYLYFVEENYSIKSLNELGRILDIKPSVLKTLLLSYVDKNMNMKKEEFKKYLQEERNKNKDNFLGKINFILKEHGIETKYIWNNDEEKEIVMKELYDYATKNKFSLASTKEISDKLGITQTRYLNLIKEYMDISKDSNKKEFISIKRVENIRGDYVREKNERLRSVYRVIINASDLDENELLELYKTIEESGYNVSHLKENFYLYEKLYSKEEVEKFYENYDIYRKFRSKLLKQKREELKKEKELENIKNKSGKAIEVLTKYIDTSNISFISFLTNNGITNEDFIKFVDIVKVCDEDLFNKYLSTKEQKEKDYKLGLEKEIKELGYRLINGYEENDKTRKFDILDYFKITSIPFSNIINISKNLLNRNEFYQLKRLKNNYSNAEKHSISEEKAIYEEKKNCWNAKR